MIRLLCIGPAAAEVSGRLQRAAPVLDIVSERLPAGAVRSFQQTPADVLVFCWTVPDARMPKVIDVLGATPLGGLTPTIAVTSGDGSHDLGVDAVFGIDDPASGLLEHIAKLLGIEREELLATATSETSYDPPPATRSEAEPSLAGLAGEVEHDTGEAARLVDRPTSRDTQPLEPAAIEAKLRHVRHNSYFDILEVSTAATTPAVRDAYETLSARFAGPAISRDLAKRYGAELDEVREALDDAFAVLSNDDLRAIYAETESP